MTRRQFGGTPADFVASVGTVAGTAGVVQVAVTTCTFWTAITGGTQITDLLNTGGGATTTITTDSHGQLPTFSGPNDGTSSMWVDAGGTRGLLLATDQTMTVTVPSGTANGLTITFASGAAGQGLEIFDHLAQPIVGVGATGGLKVFGDDLSVYNGSDLFNSTARFHSDGTVQAGKGDAAGGAGVIAIGQATTAPPFSPDGSHTIEGSTTQSGAVLWADANGVTYLKRVNGQIDPVVGSRPAGSFNAALVGDWLTPPALTLGTYTFTSSDVNRMYLVPIDVTSPYAVYNKVGAYCSVAGAGATYQQFRYGLYYDDGSLTRPNLSLQITDWGIANNGYVTLQSTTGTATFVTPYSFPAVGRIWLAVAYESSGTVTTYPTIYTAQSNLLAAGADLSTNARAWYVTGVSGALPTSGTLVATPNVPYVGLRRSA